MVISNLLVAPLTAEGLVLIITAIGGCIAGIIYAWRGIKPADQGMNQTVNRLGNAVVNLQDNQTRIAMAKPAQPMLPLKPDIDVTTPIAKKPPEVKP